MSLRSGNNKKKGQKYQNTYAFRHNKNSMTTRKILSSPLDFLCERCLEKLEWRLNYRKYKPLSTPSRCNLCQEKTIYKAYRTICDECAIKDGNKLCTKCGEKVENYGQPNCRNNPSAQVKKKEPIIALVKNLKKKYQKTVYRKMNAGVRIEYDETKGIIDMETKEIIIPLENILDKDDDGIEEGDDKDKDNDSGEDSFEEIEEENEKEEKEKEDKKGKPEFVEEIIDTSVKK